MPMYEYSSNNSGGVWWLSDENWLALEAGGWEVDWLATLPDWGGTVDKDGRWLGALAKTARKEFPTEAMAIAEFENLAGQNYSDMGCSCCGRPHYIDTV